MIRGTAENLLHANSGAMMNEWHAVSHCEVDKRYPTTFSDSASLIEVAEAMSNMMLTADDTTEMSMTAVRMRE